MGRVAEVVTARLTGVDAGEALQAVMMAKEGERAGTTERATAVRVNGSGGG